MLVLQYDSFSPSTYPEPVLNNDDDGDCWGAEDSWGAPVPNQG